MSPLSGRLGLYSAIAGDYDKTYEQPSHRRAYDRLAFDYISAMALPDQAHVVDVGCGSGRWLPYWLGRGCRVTGVEQAPGMIEALRSRGFDDRFSLLESSMETASIGPGSADLVLALGSLQYAAEPAAMIQRFANWLRPGGVLCVYVDSLVSLVQELLRDGRGEEAMLRLETRRGLFQEAGHQASLHLYDRDTLEADFDAAGLVELRSHGLAVGASALGRGGLTRALIADESRTMQRERTLSDDRAMVDCGLHILTIGRKPGI